MTDTPVAAAHRYTTQGLRVVPIRPGTKTPRINDWPNQATTNTDTVTEWWNRWPDSGVGIATGPTSHTWQLVVLDIDTHGADGWDTLNDLEHDLGVDLRDTHIVATPSGGAHLYYQAPPDPPIHSGPLLPGIDIRAHGGQILAPPTIHPDGGHYIQSFDSADTINTIPPPLLELLHDRTVTHDPPRRPAAPHTGPPRPGDLWAQTVEWADLLQADGATYCGTVRNNRYGEYQLWARPGVTDHHGATLGLYGTDVLKVHTSNWPGLQQDATYTRFGYIAATRYGGDHAAAARDMAAAGHTPPQIVVGVLDAADDQPDNNTPDDDNEPVVDNPMHWVQWDGFFTRPRPGGEWLAEPALIEGRGHVIFARAGVGKSLLALEICAALATGQPTLHQPAGPPRNILYIDYEMTEHDLIDRLTDLGYGPQHEPLLTQHLHYSLIPSIGPLNNQLSTGPGTIIHYALEHDANLVVIDTSGRAVNGDENDAATYLDLYRYTTSALKAHGIAWLRIDHAGKDPTKGQRGTSAKNDAEDIVWELCPDGDNARLVNRKGRTGWIPDKIELVRRDGPLRHTIPLDAGGVPPGTAELIKLLDDHNAPVGSRDDTRIWMQEHGLGGAKNDRLQAAVKARRERFQGDEEGRGQTRGQTKNPPRPTQQGREGDKTETAGHSGGEAGGEPGTGVTPVPPPNPPPYRGGLGRMVRPHDPDDDWTLL